MPLPVSYHSQMSDTRAYEKDFPWLNFRLGLEDLPWSSWAHLGESYSKCRHLVGTPLQPGVAMHLSAVYMRRGALASAAIEGNTLTEAEVEDIIVHDRHLPDSRSYLEQEVRNVLDALEAVRVDAAQESDFRLTPELIREVHAQILSELETDEHVTPGAFRDVVVGVGTYRGPPAEDVAYLVDELCTWINAILDEAASRTREDEAFFYWFLAATMAHLYIAWIHPFGDGSGRTARLIECAILAHSGQVPWISTNLLSDFYNKTRSRYYSVLEVTSRRKDPLLFVAYSAEGYRDQLREQVEAVQAEQRKVAWVNFVHELFQNEPTTPTTARRRLVALRLPEAPALNQTQIRHLTPEIAEAYAGTSQRLFRRDMSRLIELGLIEEQQNRTFRARIEIIDAFRPTVDYGAAMPALRR